MISKPSASHSTASRTAAASNPSAASGCFSLKTISGSIFGENIRPIATDAWPLLRVLHGVVIHVRPDERVELEHTPHRPVGEADFAPDGCVAAGSPHSHEL